MTMTMKPGPTDMSGGVMTPAKKRLCCAVNPCFTSKVDVWDTVMDSDQRLTLKERKELTGLCCDKFS